MPFRINSNLFVNTACAVSSFVFVFTTIGFVGVAYRGWLPFTKGTSCHALQDVAHC